jgi:hypothetical protein
MVFTRVHCSMTNSMGTVNILTAMAMNIEANSKRIDSTGTASTFLKTVTLGKAIGKTMRGMVSSR